VLFNYFFIFKAVFREFTLIKKVHELSLLGISTPLTFSRSTHS